MRTRSAIVVATTPVAALAVASSAWAGHGGRITFERFDPRVGKDRLHRIGPDGGGPRANKRSWGNVEWL